jgi:hypothetical protein
MTRRMCYARRYFAVELSTGMLRWDFREYVAQTGYAAPMLRFVFLFLALDALPLAAQEEGPPISITSPDTASTFVHSTIKHRTLIWDDATKTLSAEVTFVDDQQDSSQSNDDTHRFRLPGVAFDPERGIFYATSATGEKIPVAQKKKAWYLASIEPLPNAAVRIIHRHGVVTVTLEAIRPADLAKQQKPTTNADGTHSVDLRQLLP